MTAKQTIKKFGFTTKRVDTTIYKGAFGGNMNHVVILQDSCGRSLCYEGKAYTPVGRYEVFADLIKSGDLSADCFTFEFLNEGLEIVEYPGETYKGYHIVKSDELSGWFMTECKTIVGESVSEIKFDIDNF